jgi:hypothetical protein
VQVLLLDVFEVFRIDCIAPFSVHARFTVIMRPSRSLRTSSPLASHASRTTGLRMITTPNRPRLQERTVSPCQMIRKPSISSLSRPEGITAQVSCSAAAWIPRSFMVWIIISNFSGVSPLTFCVTSRMLVCA